MTGALIILALMAVWAMLVATTILTLSEAAPAFFVGACGFLGCLIADGAFQ